MIENWSEFIIGMLIGICVAGLVVTALFMIRMNLKHMMWRKVRKHEEEFHAKELKERDGVK